MLTYDKFLVYHAENPHVYRMFEKFALEAVASGRKNFGAAAIVERMRWYTSIETKGEAFKIGNDYRAFYSRIFEENHPHYAGFFRKRRSVADQKTLLRRD